MALGGVSISWDESVPSSSSNAGLGEQDIRSIKTSVRNALDSEHVFPSTGGTAGIHRPGSAVAFFAASSKISSTDTDGRLFIDSTNSRLHHVGSADTMLLGGRFAVLSAPGVRLYAAASANNSIVTSGLTQYLAMEAGRAIMLAGSTSTTVPLQHTYITSGGIGVATIQTAITGSLTSLENVASVNVSTNQMTVANVDSYNSLVPSSVSYTFTYMVLGVKAL